MCGINNTRHLPVFTVLSVFCSALLFSIAAVAQLPAQADTSVAQVPPVEVTATADYEAAAVNRLRLSWDLRIDQFVQDQRVFAVDMENPDELFAELDGLLRVRARQFELILNDAGSRDEAADPHAELLHDIFPAATLALIALPDGVNTVQDAHENFIALYLQRIRLLGYVSKDLRAEITGTDLAGMQQLYFELESIWLELRYQSLRLPAAGELVARMATRAPLPLLWFVVQLLFALVLFRWWRRWFPETIRRMQGFLLAIRPRSPEIVQRLRGLWYLQQVRPPLEWLVFLHVLISLLAFLQLEFITEISRVVVTWVFVSWFVVEFLDAVAARGAGGLASEAGKTRQRSFRLLATWLVLTGLGLSLAERLAGNAALYALIWRLSQLLAFPIVIIQLGMWRSQLYLRAEREDHEFMSADEFAQQRWLKKYVGAAQLAGFLVATWLRKLLLRSLEHFGQSRAGSSVAKSLIAVKGSGAAAEQKVDPALRDLLLAGTTSYAKYSRTLRRQLIERINHGTGGSFVVIGERGIGKDEFIRQACEGSDADFISIDCQTGSALDVEAQLCAALGISVPVDDKELLAQAMVERNIHIIAVRNLHMLVRPVVGGFDELNKMSRVFDLLPKGVTRIMGMDRYAWFYIKCALAELAASIEKIELPEWSDEQIREMFEARHEDYGKDIDYLRLQMPSQYIDPDEDTLEGRNRMGVYTMCARLSGGNPSIAMQLFVSCLRMAEDGQVYATLPRNQDSGHLEQASLHVKLVLRVIAQAENITRADIVANLRYTQSVVDNALQVAIESQWINETDGHYSLAWPWFRTITRVLSRQNLLAGVRHLS